MERTLPPILAGVVRELEAATDLSGEVLARALSAPITIDDVAPWLEFNPANYRRNLVVRRPGFELRLLCWLPRQRTSLHGHDGSACAFRILQGTSTEIRLREPDRTWTPGLVVVERGASPVHQITNLGNEPLVSLHAYSPALPVDQPPASYEGRQIVIIGGGVAGAALAIHLLAGAARGSRIAISDPWRANALREIDPGEDILLIGTGLTAVDVVVALRGQQHRGRVLAVSRRGLTPRPHLSPDDPRKRAVAIDPGALPRDARSFVRWLRRETARLEAEGTGWQCLIDALRPHTHALWGGLGDDEQSRFMRLLRPYWEVVRHRADPRSLAIVGESVAAGQLAITAGRLSEIRDEDDGLHVAITARSGGSIRDRFDRLILCTGPDTDVRRWTSPLFRQLLRDDHIRPDRLALGVVTDPEGRAVGERGVTPWLYTLGSLRRPRLWETTSVPDIVRQAVELARVLDR